MTYKTRDYRITIGRKDNGEQLKNVLYKTWFSTLMPSYVKKTITKLKDVLLQYNKTIIKLSRKYFAMFKQTKAIQMLYTCLFI